MGRAILGQSGEVRTGMQSRGFADYTRNQQSSFVGTRRVPYKVYGEPEVAEARQTWSKKRTGVATQPRTIKAANYSDRWPKVFIGRKVDASETGRPWREFEAKLARGLYRKGSPVPLKNWMLVYFNPEQMRDILTERFEKKSRTASEGELRNIAKMVVKNVNESIGILQRKKLEADQVKYDESPLLWRRVLDPDNLDLELADKAICNSREDMVNNMWLPARFKSGRQEGYGSHGFGIHLPDSDGCLAEEAAAVDGIMRSFGFDTLEAQRQRQFALKVVDTSPLQANGIVLTFPGYPQWVPLRETHAEVQM